LCLSPDFLLLQDMLDIAYVYSHIVSPLLCDKLGMANTQTV
jgi:hypothetical protein